MTRAQRGAWTIPETFVPALRTRAAECHRGADILVPMDDVGPGAGEDETVAAARSGDLDALERLLVAYGPVVRASLDIPPTYRSMIDDDDVMQVTYMDAFARIDRFAGSSSVVFRRWLTQIARNNLLDAIRSLERAKRPSPRRRITASAGDSGAAPCERLGVTSTTPSRVIRTGEARGLVERALADLPPRYAEVIRCFDLEGLSGPEVARRLGCSRVTAFMLRARAHDRLRELLGPASRFATELR